MKSELNRPPGNGTSTLPRVQQPLGYNDPYSKLGGPVFRFFFRKEIDQSLQVLKLRTVESSFAPANKGWGTILLLIWRLLLAGYFSGYGIIWGWIDYWEGRVIPPVYLTHWGLLATAIYFIVASFNSIHTVFFHALNRPLSRFWRWLTAIQIFLFELTVVLETLITILYWSFESSPTCDLNCLTGHALGNGALIIELFISRMPIRPRHVLLTIIYPLGWIGSQIVWVYTNHPPAYPDTLTMRNPTSAYICVLGIVVFVICHFIFYLIGLARDKLCQGTFYPANEGKEFGRGAHNGEVQLEEVRSSR